MIGHQASLIEEHLSAEVIFYDGAIHPAYQRQFRDFIEGVVFQAEKPYKTIFVAIRTGGGSVETAEGMVQILRKHYEQVFFAVPDYAMSAGTILCMSGDKIYMDYSSALGPIDPQVFDPNSQSFVPAMGYLDKVAEIADKDSLTSADVILLKDIDLARLALFEQARDLSIDLLKNWLVQYKFKDWRTHGSSGKPVTNKQKIARARQIAKSLADHKRWLSHGRQLDISKLTDLKIKIDDYTESEELFPAIRCFNDTITAYIDRTNTLPFFYNRRMPI